MSPALGRIHVGRRGPGEHHGAGSSSEQAEASDHRRYREQRRPEPGQQTAYNPENEPSRQHGDTAQAIHRVSCHEGGKARHTQEYGRSQAGEAIEAGDRRKGLCGHRHRELVHPVERRHATREQQRVADDRVLSYEYF